MPRLVAADPETLAEACRVLRKGGLVAFPTETVFGVGCLARSETGRSHLYAMKQRDAEQSTQVLVASVDAARPWAFVSPPAERLAQRYWPGPLTLVLRATPEASAMFGSVVSAGTIGVRVPDHPVPLSLLELLAEPIASSSANVAGADPPTAGRDALAAVGDAVDLVFDGESTLKRASSILDLTSSPPRLLREGSIPAEILLR